MNLSMLSIVIIKWLVHSLHNQERKKLNLESGRPDKKAETRSSKKRSVSAKDTKLEVDILSPAAMQNVYYISHNAVDWSSEALDGLSQQKIK